MRSTIINRVRRLLSEGTSDQIELGVGELEGELDLARSAWDLFRHPSWTPFCKFWENKAANLRKRLETADLEGIELGRVQGQLRVLKDLLSVESTFTKEAEEVKEGIALLRKHQKEPQNIRSDIGDPEIRRLMAEDKASRKQHL